MTERKQARVKECPQQLQSTLHKVFRGIHVGKNALAEKAADAFNRALWESHRVITRLVALGVVAIRCYAVGQSLQLVLQPMGSKDTFTIVDTPAAFVTA